MAGKSKKFRIATEGATTDGRVIERMWIEQMAKSYDPQKFGARINLEHIKGINPDGPFRRYGDVLSLTAEKVEDGKLALFAVIDPTDELVKMTTKDRQKVYTSCEINPDFAGSGEAYLIGLAVTDDPASLGTEMLQFSATAKSSPLAKRKTDPANLFSEAVEFSLELEEENKGQSLLEGFSDKIKTMFSSASKATAADTAELRGAIEVIADTQKQLLEQFAALPQAPSLKPLQDKVDQLSAAHDELVQTLSQEPQRQPRDRTPGGSTGETVTDC